MFKTTHARTPDRGEELMAASPVLIPQGMSGRSAADLLDAAGLTAAPVVDSRGRYVGVFTAVDWQRWRTRDCSGPSTRNP